MKAMEEAHITVPENWIVQGDFEPESGYRAMQQILTQSSPDRGVLRWRYYGDGRVVRGR
jgi:DNA-binding LacI/PurR family transcriptional regulator